MAYKLDNPMDQEQLLFLTRREEEPRLDPVINT